MLKAPPAAMILLTIALSVLIENLALLKLPASVSVGKQEAMGVTYDVFRIL